MGKSSVGRLYRPLDFEVGCNNIVSNYGFSDVNKDIRTHWVIVSKRSALMFSNVVGGRADDGINVDPPSLIVLSRTVSWS